MDLPGDGKRRPVPTLRGYADSPRDGGKAAAPDARSPEPPAAEARRPEPPRPQAEARHSAPEPPPGPGDDGRPSQHEVVRRSGTPLVEIEVTHEHGPAPRNERPRRAVEIWTQNRVYVLDATLHCIDVIERASDTTDLDHPFRGARLVGGQATNGSVMELSHPFPRPGTEAVFEQLSGGRAVFSRTSPVTRVVLRFHIVTVSSNNVIPTWEEITGALKPPGA